MHICWACREPIADDPHTNSDGEDVHEECCDVCAEHECPPVRYSAFDIINDGCPVCEDGGPHGDDYSIDDALWRSMTRPVVYSADPF